MKTLSRNQTQQTSGGLLFVPVIIAIGKVVTYSAAGAAGATAGYYTYKATKKALKK
ncbi:hypothetical protein [uncultured Pseudoteredinibacter sp.]|uniref:hypothetical protein n=1 Tax=uncultured Pseudoteredinibacter sp. TaxID=1641701 RepID=UPI002632C676|nr:hypothetical protein [uncultured Pseudoteredinibacter sp.]